MCVIQTKKNGKWEDVNLGLSFSDPEEANDALEALADTHNPEITGEFRITIK